MISGLVCRDVNINMSEEMEEGSTQVESLDSGVVKELCRDYAQFTRVNISEEHGQVSLQSPDLL